MPIQITTKEEFLKLMDEIGRTLTELESPLTRYKQQADLLKAPKLHIIRIATSVTQQELQLHANVTVISILKMKTGLNALLQDYSLIKKKVNHSASARSSYDLSTVEQRQSRDQKRQSNQFQIDANIINNDVNDFMLELDAKINAGEYIEWDLEEGELRRCGGMTQIDPPSLQLDAGSADTTIDSVVDDLQGIVILC